MSILFCFINSQNSIHPPKPLDGLLSAFFVLVLMFHPFQKVWKRLHHT